MAMAPDPQQLQETLQTMAAQHTPPSQLKALLSWFTHGQASANTLESLLALQSSENFDHQLLQEETLYSEEIQNVILTEAQPVPLALFTPLKQPLSSQTVSEFSLLQEFGPAFQKKISYPLLLNALCLRLEKLFRQKA